MFRQLACIVFALGASLTAGPPAEPGNVVLDWNVIALETTAAAPFNPPLETRNLAIVHAAMFDAVNAVDHRFHPYLAAVRAHEGASAEAAAIAAGHEALVALYPAQRARLDAAYRASIRAIADGSPKTDGVRLGEAAAREILVARATDGAVSAVVASYVPGKRAGDWTPTIPAFAAALDPGWGSVQPFLLRTASQFRPGPPPSLDSATYARDFNEIKAIGGSASTTRSTEQGDLARLWVATAAQNWNSIARSVARAKEITLLENARALALLNLAGADAFIAAWDAKYAYSQWRPVTAIRAADVDRNPDTEADRGWTPLLVTPPFPDYVAGHTAYAGAAQKVLEHLFGSQPGVPLTLTSPTAPGVVMSYATFEQIADGVVDARVYGGIHWRTSSARGRLLGEQVGAFAVQRFPVR